MVFVFLGLLAALLEEARRAAARQQHAQAEATLRTFQARGVREIIFAARPVLGEHWYASSWEPCRSRRTARRILPRPRCAASFSWRWMSRTCPSSVCRVSRRSCPAKRSAVPAAMSRAPSPRPLTRPATCWRWRAGPAASSRSATCPTCWIFRGTFSPFSTAMAATDPIDVYATERRYWTSLWYQPGK